MASNVNGRDAAARAEAARAEAERKSKAERADALRKAAGTFVKPTAAAKTRFGASELSSGRGGALRRASVARLGAPSTALNTSAARSPQTVQKDLEGVVKALNDKALKPAVRFELQDSKRALTTELRTSLDKSIGDLQASLGRLSPDERGTAKAQLDGYTRQLSALKADALSGAASVRTPEQINKDLADVDATITKGGLPPDIQQALQNKKTALTTELKDSLTTTIVQLKQGLDQQPQNIRDDLNHRIGELQTQLDGLSTPAESAAKVRAAAASSPRAGAEALQAALEAHPGDAAFAAALIDQTKDVITQMAKSLPLTDPNASQDLKDTMAALARAGELAGPEGAKAMGVAFANGLPPNAPSTDAFYETIRATMAEGDGMSFVAGITVGLQSLASANGPDANGYAILLERTVNTTADGLSQINTEMKESSEKVKDLNAELARLTSTFGPGMSDADKQKAIDGFKAAHQAEYAAYEEAGRKSASVLPGIGLMDQDPTFQKFEGGQIREIGDQLAGQIGDISGTKAGSDAIAQALVAEGEGRPTFIDAVHAISESKEGAQAILRGAAQAAIEFAGKGDAEGMKAVLEGLRKNPKLFGLEQEDMDKLTEVLGRFQPGMTDAQLGQTSAELKGDIEGLEAEGKLPKDGVLTQSLKGIGVVFGLYGATKDLVTGFNSADFQDKVKLVADQLGADAGAGTFVLEALGKASETLKTFGAATAAISGVISAFEALDLFSKGKVAEGIASSASAIGGLLITAGELGLEVPGGQIIGGVLIVAGALGELVVNWYESNDRERKFEKDAQIFLEAGGVPPNVAHLLAKDVDDQGNNSGMAMNAIAKRLGMSTSQFYAWLSTKSDGEIQQVIDATHHIGKNKDGTCVATSPADPYAGPGRTVNAGRAGNRTVEADPQSVQGLYNWLAYKGLLP